MTSITSIKSLSFTTTQKDTTRIRGFFHALSAYALLGSTLGFIGMLLFVFRTPGGPVLTFSPPVIFTFAALLFAAIIFFTNWRWTPLLSILFSAVQFKFNLERILNVMAAAAKGPDFYLATAILAFILVGFLAGIVALIFNYSSKSGHVVRQWGINLLYTLTGIVLGVYLLAAVMAAPKAELHAYTGALPELTITSPEKQIKVKAGTPGFLKVKNSTPFALALHIDGLGVHTVIAQGDNYVPFYPAKPGRYTYIGTMDFHKKKTPAQGIRTFTGERLEGIIVVE